MTLGLFEKVVLADTMLSGSADRVFGYGGPLIALDSWMGVIAFAGQIFFDFAGYSTCAIGAALCLGFHLKDNFRFPYAAIGFSDFWRRWHISLSTFLRDYLYIPLGGNRVGWARAAINLVIVMFLGGLWHGAAWTFVVWGLLHGFYLVIEHTLARVLRRTRRGPIRSSREDPARPGHLCRGLSRLGLFPRVRFHRRHAHAARHVRRARATATRFFRTREMLQIGIVTFFMILAHWSLRDISIEQAVERLPRWVVTAVVGGHGLRHHSHPRKQQCLHLLPVLMFDTADPGAAVARHHRHRGADRHGGGGGLGTLCPLASATLLP